MFPKALAVGADIMCIALTAVISFDYRVEQVTTSRRNMSARTRYDVMPGNGGWTVKRGDARTTSVYASKAEAVRAAQAGVENKGGELRIHGKRGELLRTVTIGRDRFEKISAVEGLRPTSEARHRAGEFDRKGLSPDERRRAIIKAYSAKT